MVRQIYEVYAKIVDANGSYNTLSGYPKVFDSKLNNNDLDKTFRRAVGEFHETVGSMYKIDTRQLQTVILMTADGVIMKHETIGELAELPDPEPNE